MNAKIDGIKRDMVVLYDGLKSYMEVMMNVKMEGLKEGWTKLLQEMLHSGGNVFHENKDKEKRKMNYDFRDSNSGLKTNQIPKIDMRKFDGKDPVTWILEMEQYFDLHNVKNTQKVHIAYLYLEPNQFVWYQWIFSRKKNSLRKFLWKK